MTTLGLLQQCSKPGSMGTFCCIYSMTTSLTNVMCDLQAAAVAGAEVAGAAVRRAAAAAAAAVDAASLVAAAAADAALGAAAVAAAGAALAAAAVAATRRAAGVQPQGKALDGEEGARRRVSSNNTCILRDGAQKPCIVCCSMQPGGARNVERLRVAS